DERGRKDDLHRMIINEPNHELRAFLQHPLAIADNSRRNRELIVSLHVHEDIAGLILVEKLVVLGDQVGAFELVGLIEATLDDVPGLHVAQLGLQHGPALSGLLDVVILDDPVNAFERDNHALFELCRSDHAAALNSRTKLEWRMEDRRWQIW